jgi:hypothetical protein
MSGFDMNQVLRSCVRDEEREPPASDAESGGSIGGKSDAGAGTERSDTAGTDMNVFLREAVFESRGRPS